MHGLPSSSYTSLSVSSEAVGGVMSVGGGGRWGGGGGREGGREGRGGEGREGECDKKTTHTHTCTHTHTHTQILQYTNVPGVYNPLTHTHTSATSMKTH